MVEVSRDLGLGIGWEEGDHQVQGEVDRDLEMDKLDLEEGRILAEEVVRHTRVLHEASHQEGDMVGRGVEEDRAYLVRVEEEGDLLFPGDLGQERSLSGLVDLVVALDRGPVGILELDVHPDLVVLLGSDAVDFSLLL